jgi:hypothetical protein
MALGWIRVWDFQHVFTDSTIHALGRLSRLIRPPHLLGRLHPCMPQTELCPVS